MNNQSLIYVSTDIETNGPHIGKNSMLSLGSAAFLEDQSLHDTFTVNLETLPNGEENPVTMAWWQNFPNAWRATRENCLPPAIGIIQYVEWLKKLPGRPIFVGYPLAFDFSYVVYYLNRFANENPFGFSAIDLRSLAMGLHRNHYLKSAKHNWPKHWFSDDIPHTHIALDDALEQGAIFCQMLAELTSDSN